ncbi:hypothetical protein HY622_00260 [Candidatus Uhrbacteria bacterium]|nr:hypothetical protein [Candidatus Uhrbacteria bacterium]
MHFFYHIDGKKVHGLPEGTTVLGQKDDGTIYTLTVAVPEGQRVLYQGTYTIERNSTVLDLAELKLRPADDRTTDHVALLIISAPHGAVEHIVKGNPTPVLRITKENDGDSWTVLVLEMTAGQRVEIITRTNSPEVIDFNTDLGGSMRQAAAR